MYNVYSKGENNSYFILSSSSQEYICLHHITLNTIGAKFLTHHAPFRNHLVTHNGTVLYFRGFPILQAALTFGAVEVY